MSDIKPIETSYKGYRFRSRLEARWAVFFDNMGIEWRYEDEGYQLDSGWYLPDFLLKQHKNQLFFEVKSQEPTHKEKSLCFDLAKDSGIDVLLAYGNVGVDFDEDGWCKPCFKSVLFSGYRPIHRSFTRDLIWLGIRLPAFLVSNGFDVPGAWMLDSDETTEKYIEQIVNMDREYYQKKYGKAHSSWEFGVTAEFFLNGRGGLSVDHHEYGSQNYWPERMVNAFDAARAARFEHGETP